MVDSRKPLLTALRSKAGRYGKLEYPYILAVNVTNMFIDEIDIKDALFGKEQFVYDWQTNETTAERARDGFWFGSKGPINTRVSAVILLTRLRPWAVATTTPMLWHNPWANLKFDADLWQGKQMLPDFESRQMKPSDGKPNNEMFGLEIGWPEI